MKMRIGRPWIWIGLLVLVAGLASAGWRQRTLSLQQKAKDAAFQRTIKLELQDHQRAIDTWIARLKAAIAAAPNDVQARWTLADAYQKTNQIPLAAPQLEAIVRLQPGNEAAALALANVLLALKDYPGAEKMYRLVSERWPKTPDGWMGLAAVLYQDQRYSEAAQAANHAVTLDPSDASNQYVLATSLLEDAMQFPNPQARGGEILQARALLLKLVKEMPQEGDIYYRLGRAYMGIRNTSESIKNLQKAAQMLPDRQDIAIELANALIGAGNRPAARRVVTAAIQRHPDSAALYSLMGKLLQESGAPGSDQQALAAFSKAAKINPADPSILERLGVSLLRNKKINEARLAFEKAARVYPNRAFSYQQLAAIYTRLGHPREATRAAKAAREMVFNDQQLKQIQNLSLVHPEAVALHIVLADRYRALGLMGAARDEYLDVLQIDPHNAHAIKALATFGKAISTAKAQNAQALAAPSAPAKALRAPKAHQKA